VLSPFAPDRFVGSVYRVEGGCAEVTLPSAGRRASSYYGQRLARGEVGEFVVIDIGGLGLVGRVAEVWLPARERELAEASTDHDIELHPVGRVQLLSTLRPDGHHVRGIARYPRVGDAAYAANADALRALIADDESDGEDGALPAALISMGTLASDEQVAVDLNLNRVFGRHLAVLGATGSGKSWTLAHLVEEVAAVGGKLLLLDATGEFYTLGDLAEHVSIGGLPDRPGGCLPTTFPHTSMGEADFNAFLRPSPGAQLPKLREAVRSLRLARALGSTHELVNEEGCVPKMKRLRRPFFEARDEHATTVEDSASPFDLQVLPRQIQHECVYEHDRDDPKKFGGQSNDVGYCTGLTARIHDILQTPSVMEVIAPAGGSDSALEVVDRWLKGNRPVLRLSLRLLPSAHALREIVVNSIGRYLLEQARHGRFEDVPLVVFVDEAHQFFGRSVGDEQLAVRLDNFESIAKEGRKYGVTICMATQRPADLPAGVISQAGMLLVHRLGDGRDRDHIERASSELDRSAASLLPGLTPGEALFVGVDFPVPVAVRMTKPTRKPKSEGPHYGTGWRGATGSGE
jgi:energy-coupling factor transporter ATP-binding protein EcfA2